LKRLWIEGSVDGKNWRTFFDKTAAHAVESLPLGQTTDLRFKLPARLPDLSVPSEEWRYLRLNLFAAAGRNAGSFKSGNIKNLAFYPPAAAQSDQQFYFKLAEKKPRGVYPKYLTKTQTYWTSVPMPVGKPLFSALPGVFNEEGMVEFGSGLVSVEPSLGVDGEWLTWAQADSLKTGFAEQGLPMPASEWKVKDLEFQVAAFARPFDQAPVTFLRYRIKNNSSRSRKAQVNLRIHGISATPPWQLERPSEWLSSGLTSLSFDGFRIEAKNLSKTAGGNAGADLGPYALVPLEAQVSLAKTSPDSDQLRRRIASFRKQARKQGRVPQSWDSQFATYRFGVKSGLSAPIAEDWSALGASGVTWLEDPEFHPVGLLQFEADLAPGETRDFYLAAVQLGGLSAQRADALVGEIASRKGSDEWRNAVSGWRNRLAEGPQISGPQQLSRLVETQKSAFAQILANRREKAFEPGPRRYATSWIRDGAVMASTLLQMGSVDEAKEFLRWFAGFQYSNGFVPCCITENREEPKYIEHDSGGQFIFLAAEIFRYTRDRQLVRELWPGIQKAVHFIAALRAERMTPEYQSRPELQAYFGLLPASVSHEGYLGNPSHAYWDDYWALRGLRDAVTLAQALEMKKEEVEWRSLEEDFRTTLFASIERVIRDHHLTYIPASVEMAESDPSVASQVLSLLGDGERLPQKQLQGSFESYWETVQGRIRGQYKQAQYTAYELRLIDALIRFGWRERAWEALQFYLQDQRPASWNQWPEITWRDPSLPTGVGDMPHSWISAEYLRSFRSIFAYEEQVSNSLVIAAGLPLSWWNSPGVPALEVAQMPTYFGKVSYRLGVSPSEGNAQEYLVRLKLSGISAEVVWPVFPGCKLEDYRLLSSAGKLTSNPQKSQLRFESRKDWGGIEIEARLNCAR
jgi:hypothetical protein